MAQGAYAVSERTMVVIALGPKVFDDEGAAERQAEMPPDTTVVWLIAVDDLGHRPQPRPLEAQRLPQLGAQPIGPRRL